MNHSITTKTVSALALALLCATGAQAQKADAKTTGVYTELGYTFVNHKDNLAGLKPFSGNAGMLRGIVGYNLHENVAVEGMVGVGVSGKKSIVDGDTLTAKPSNMVGAFAKPKLALGDSAELFGRVGYVSTKLDGDTGRANGLGWGLGGAYRVTPALAITADYMRYYSKNSQTLDGFTLGVNYRF